jgi:molybdopterin molybdotransferase
VRPFLDRLCGARPRVRPAIAARLSRNLESAPGRVDFVRVRLFQRQGETWAEPILGKSGLIRTMVEADGLIAIDMNTEGLEQGESVAVQLF